MLYMQYAVPVNIGKPAEYWDETSVSFIWPRVGLLHQQAVGVVNHTDKDLYEKWVFIQALASRRSVHHSFEC